jgi:hypothetical protein
MIAQFDGLRLHATEFVYQSEARASPCQKASLKIVQDFLDRKIS